jgi:stress response protein YsnF
VQKVAVSPKLAEVHDEVLRLAEEQLQVGKRMVETGMTRVRRFVTEKEVSADVTLHEEHAEVLRRAVTDPKYVGDIDWADATIEIRETAGAGTGQQDWAGSRGGRAEEDRQRSR